MGVSDLLRKRAANENEQRWERARPSLERNGLTSRSDGLGIAHLESGHTVITPYAHEQGQWRMWVMHEDDPDYQRKIIADLGPGDEDVDERAVAALRHPQVLRSMREQMRPGEADESWPRRFSFTGR